MDTREEGLGQRRGDKYAISLNLNPTHLQKGGNYVEPASEIELG